MHERQLMPVGSPGLAYPASTPARKLLGLKSNPKFYLNKRLLNNTAKMAAEKTAAWEKSIQRNPHPDFKKVEASRPPFDPSTTFTYTQTPSPNWQFGSGANSTTSPEDATKKHISIDPYEADRPAGFNYKLLISAIIPRPIAFLSTRSADGANTNLAVFSYFQVIGHDPPLFVVGFASALEAGRAKDSLRNLHERGECVINMVGEGFVEAANSTSINAPYGVSEWDVSGLTPVYDCETVGCARVKEAVFSIEGKLESVREFESRATPGKVTATLAVIEGTRFWAREDAVNEERNLIDTKVLKPISRLGGITYGRQTEAYELPRPDFEKDLGGMEGAKKLEKKHVPN
ncbi:hypothetical protein CHGG_03397 [Chaetomium globosum CBS 148.51]|uniref:Flavin reductase like domain-containing protein n=1 Tax=Chaetomium globosum (strain ATCC 6205 / CBS 148.51 / DSM 1962 / NBRC 6347 / NRRL 1970) TaxID=306901 RepID=Q2H8Q7_CHAGB|nr:uncharacterized protein CHGG_03397 [Chaetomium globosum CBS 148.51]EAQ91462.1 hypothetical protein CHGG_03397 [Chaetomium globosum CBS 148.51]